MEVGFCVEVEENGAFVDAEYLDVTGLTVLNRLATVSLLELAYGVCDFWG